MSFTTTLALRAASSMAYSLPSPLPAPVTMAASGSAAVSWPRDLARCFFFEISEHADGERRGPVLIWRYLKTRLAETFRMPPSDPI